PPAPAPNPTNNDEQATLVFDCFALGPPPRSRVGQPADVVDPSVDETAMFDRRSFEAEEAIDQWIGVEIVDRRHTHGGEELACLHRLQYRIAGAVAKLDPRNAARTIKSRNAISEKLAQRRICRRLFVDGLDHGDIVLITQAV